MMTTPLRVNCRRKEPNRYQDAELSFVAFLLNRACAKVGGEYREEEGNYYHTARGKSYQVFRDELPTFREADAPVGETPVVAHLLPHGGNQSEHLAKPKVSGEQGANLLSRYRVRVNTLCARLKTGIGKPLTRVHRLPDSIVAWLSSGVESLLLNREGSENTASFLAEGQSGSRVSGEKNSLKKSVTILYEVKGDSLHLADADWSELLTLAIENGWKPRGTDAPPTPLGVAKPQWDGRYDDAEGQLTRFDDARELGQALQTVVLRDSEIVNRLREVILALISWTAKGGFIICRETPDDAPPLKTAGQLSSLSSKLSSFYAADVTSGAYSGEPRVQAHLQPVK